MFKKIIFIIILGFAVLIIFSFLYLKEESPSPTEQNKNGMMKITIANKEILVYIADEPNEQIQGLSGKVSMAEDEGMLFVFPDSFIATFWMKDMNFPLDMIWIDANKKVIGIEKNISPDTFPKTFSPASPIKYVLEVNAGWSDKNQVKSGDKLSTVHSSSLIQKR